MFSDMERCFECNYKMETKDSLEPNLIKSDFEEMAFINYPDTTSVVPIGISSESNDGHDDNRGACAPMSNSDGFLFSEFIVEFERFLGEFIVDRKINIK